MPLAAAMGHAVLDYIETHGLVQRAAETGAYLKAQLETMLELDCVGDMRGEGRFLGVEFVADKATKAPFPAAKLFAKRVQALALEQGLVTYACRGTVELTRGDHMLFAPPLVIDRAQCDDLVAKLELAVVAARDELR